MKEMTVVHILYAEWLLRLIAARLSTGEKVKQYNLKRIQTRKKRRKRSKKEERNGEDKLPSSIRVRCDGFGVHCAVCTLPAYPIRWHINCFTKNDACCSHTHTEIRSRSNGTKSFRISLSLCDARVYLYVAFVSVKRSWALRWRNRKN